MSKPNAYATPEDVEQAFYQMVVQGDADLLEEGGRIEGEDVCRLLVGEEVDDYRDEAGDDGGV